MVHGHSDLNILSNPKFLAFLIESGKLFGYTELKRPAINTNPDHCFLEEQWYRAVA